MPYTVAKLLTNAYYTSGIVSRNFQTVTGQQESDGLDLLNDLLGVKSANTALVPYFRQHDFTAVVGQERYDIDNLLEVDTFTFTIGSVRYSTQGLSRRPYFGSPRVNNVQSLPFNWHFERQKGGGSIFIYFKPNTTYPLQIWGKFGFDSVEFNDDLEETYDRYYITYLRYALADYICADNNTILQPQNAQKLKEMEAFLNTVSPPDISLGKVSTLTNGPTLSYAQINLGQGFTPTSS